MKGNLNHCDISILVGRMQEPNRSNARNVVGAPPTLFIDGKADVPVFQISRNMLRCDEVVHLVALQLGRLTGDGNEEASGVGIGGKDIVAVSRSVWVSVSGCCAPASP